MAQRDRVPGNNADVSDYSAPPTLRKQRQPINQVQHLLCNIR